MAVPPGNKQVGQLAITAVTSQNPTTIAVSAATFCILKNSVQAAVPPHKVKNAMIGSLGLAAVTSNGKSVTAANFATFVVLRLAAYVKATAENAITLVTLRDQTVQDTRVAPKDLYVGQLSIGVAVSSPVPTVTATALQAFVVVRKFQPRHEHITLNIEYAASAKFNTEDLL